MLYFSFSSNLRWIRSEDDDRRDALEPNGNGHKAEEGDEADHIDSAVANSRTKLAKMAVEAIKVRVAEGTVYSDHDASCSFQSEVKDGRTELETVLQRQNWLDELRKVRAELELLISRRKSIFLGALVE